MVKFFDICNPDLAFDEFMEGIDLSKYLKEIPEHKTGRIRYNPINMLKIVIFGFMSQGYISLRDLEDNCKLNMRFMYLMDNKKLHTEHLDILLMKFLMNLLKIFSMILIKLSLKKIM